MSGTAVSAELVGRGEELGELAAALDVARGGHAVAVLLGGEAGVGKTRLTAEFNALVGDSVRTLVGQCVELGSDGLPYAPIAGALRTLAAELGADTVFDLAGPARDALAALLPDLAGSRTPTDGRGRLFDVITVLLERLAAQQPMVFVIEDLHWADGSTRDLLRFAVRALVRSPILLVLTYRTDEVTRAHPLRPFLAELDRLANVRRLDVPPLSECQVAEQLRGLLGYEPDTALVRRVATRSEGVPFFVEELATAEAECGQDVPLPESLRDLLLVRVDRLSADTRTMLRTLAAGTGPVRHELLQSVVDAASPDLETRLHEAVSANVIRVEADAYAFRHALLREAVHADLLPGEHARLHLRYADALEQRPDLVGPGSAAMEIAHHLQAAHEQDRAFRAYLQAASEASESVAFREAQLAFERALELWYQVPDAVGVAGVDHAELVARAAAAAADAGETERSLALVDDALRDPAVAADPERHARLLYRRALLLSDDGRGGGLPTLREALALLDGLPESQTLARVLQKLGGELMMWGRYEEALDTARQAAEVARRVGARSAEFRAHNTLGPVLVALGRTEDGFDALATAAELSSDSPRLSAGYHINFSDVLALLGRYRQAADTAIAGIERARASGVERTLGAMMSGNAAEPLLALGEWDRAERIVERGLELEPPLRHMLHLLRLQASIRLWRGDLASATQLSDRLSALIRGRQPTPQYTIPFTTMTAELALATGDPGTAWDRVRAVLDTVLVPGYDLPLLAVAARALAEQGRRGADRTRLSEDRDRVRTRMAAAASWGPGASWQLLVDAELAGDDPARLGQNPDRWRAVVACLALPLHLPAYAGLRLGAALLAVGDRPAAQQALAQALARAEHLGAGLLTGRIDGLARRGRLRLADSTTSPAPAAPTAPTEASGDSAASAAAAWGLTPREREVLALVARGRSNRQIGTELFISTKTASVHVSNILAKLGVSGRGEAAARARAEGMLGDAAMMR